MRKIKFSGLPAGQATISAGGTSASATLSAEVAPTEDVVALAELTASNPDFRGFGGNITQEYYNSIFKSALSGIASGYMTNRLIAQAGSSGDTIICDQDQLTRFETIAEGAYVGGEVQVRRVVDGTYTLQRISAIDAHNSSGWRLETGATEIGVGTSCTLLFSPDWKAGDLHVAIRPTNAAGEWGALQYVGVVDIANPESLTAGVTSVGTPTTELTEVENLSIPAVTGLSAALEGDGTRTIRISYDALPSGVEGVAVFFSHHDPATHKGYSLALANDGGAAVLPGDEIVIRKKAAQYRHTWQGVRGWDLAPRYIPSCLRDSTTGWPDDNGGARTWEIVDSVGAPQGDAYLHLTLPEAETFTMQGSMAAGEGREPFDFYPLIEPNRTIRFSFWGRASTACDATLAFANVPAADLEFWNGSEWVQASSQTFPLTASWQAFTVDFRWAQNTPGEGKIYQQSLSVTGPIGGATVDFASIQTYYADTPFAALLPEAKAVMGGNVEHLRDISPTKSLTGGYSVQEMTNRPGNVAYYWDSPVTLSRALEACEEIGATPYLQFDPYFTPDEAREWWAYLAAPVASGHPMALKRQAQGRTEPYITAATPRVYFEVGLEVWNNGFVPWASNTLTDNGSTPDYKDGQSAYTTGEVYGMWLQWYLDELAQSPFWLPDVVMPSLGGLRTQADLSFLADAVSRCPSAKVATIAPYLKGWELLGSEPFAEVPRDYRGALFYAALGMTDYANSLNAYVRDVYGVEIGTYESGPGFAGASYSHADPVNVAEQRVSKSKAMAVAMVDCFLKLASEGCTVQSWFSFSEDVGWSSNASYRNGRQIWPTWMLLRWINENAIGPVRRVRVIREPVEADGGSGAEDAAGVQCYVVERPDGAQVVFIVNRNLPYDTLAVDDPLRVAHPGDDGVRSVRLRFPPRPANIAGTRYSLSGAYDQHAWDQASPNFHDFQILETAATLPADGDLVVDIPPAEVWIYRFAG